jgi:hypothetical protein
MHTHDIKLEKAIINGAIANHEKEFQEFIYLDK